jgi:septum formation protein
VPSTQLVLASASPRRRELLAQAGFCFRVEAADIPEEPQPGEDPIAYVTRLAREKAEVVQARLRDPNARVLGADTTVVIDGRILGKPESADDAASMLRRLSGRTHQVMTGVAIVTGEGAKAQTLVAAEITAVQFHSLSQREIDDYVATGEPMDKAGAYAIQGRAACWIPRIHGCYFNVVGLPLALVANMLAALMPANEATSASE